MPGVNSNQIISHVQVQYDLNKNESDLKTHTCDAIIQAAEAGRLQTSNQPSQHRKRLKKREKEGRKRVEKDKKVEIGRGGQAK